MPDNQMDNAEIADEMAYDEADQEVVTEMDGEETVVDDNATEAAEEPAQAEAPATPTVREFRIGRNRIIEDPSMIGVPIPEIQKRLARTYPEIANATYREVQEDGKSIYEFIARAGIKG